jgi:hypothetical protein
VENDSLEFEDVYEAMRQGYFPAPWAFSLMEPEYELAFGRTDSSYWELLVLKGGRVVDRSLPARFLVSPHPEPLRKPYEAVFHEGQARRFLLSFGIREALWILGHMGGMRAKRGVYPSVAARFLGVKDGDELLLLEKRPVLTGWLLRMYVRALEAWGDEGDWGGLLRVEAWLREEREGSLYLPLLAEALAERARSKRGRKPKRERLGVPESILRLFRGEFGGSGTLREEEW